MICSSDILALARGQEQVDCRTQWSRVLPDQLSLPPLPHPWVCSPAPHDDLVLLCEFSEEEKPQLLYVAPPTSKPHPRLDLVLRLLTVGYQATGSRASSGRGCLEDSWVLLGDSFEGVFVYARYVLLLDLHAGGAVWPVAMALVSHDSVKLLQGLEELNEAFGKAACSMQTAHTHSHSYTHTHTLPHTQIQEAFTPVVSGAGPQPLVERCDWFFYQQTLELLQAIHQRFHGDASLLAHRRDSAHLLPRLSSTNVLWEPLSRSNALHGELSPSNPLHGDLRPSNCLHGDLYVSCIQAVPIKLVVEGQSHDAPDVPDVRPSQEAISMETSSHSSGDSIEVLATERSFRGPDVAQVVAMETSWGRGAWRGPGRGAWRTDSQDSSIEVLSRDPFLPDDLRPSDTLLQGLMGTVVKEEEEGQGEVGTVVQEEEDDGGTDKAHLQGIMGSAVQDDAHLQGIMGGAVQDDAHQQGIMGSAVQDDAHQQGIMGSAVQDDAHQQGIMGSAVKESQSSMPTTTPYLYDNLFQEVCPQVGLLPLCPIGQEDNSDCGSTSSSDSSHSSGVSWQCGEAALRLVRCWEPVRHAVFSLLTGRLLVVLGSKKKQVMELVHALELFLPHTHTHTHTHTRRVLPWCCRHIQTTDLLEYSIIGLNRRICSSAPRMPFCLERYARYISLLDADHMTLRCPAYRGTLIGRLTQPQSQLREGGTYGLLVQSALTRLAAQAFHHVFSGQEVALPLGAADDDVRILNFLCDLIKLHLTHHAPSTVLRFSYQPCTLFR